MTESETGHGEMRVSWRLLHRALDLPITVEIVGVECRAADTLDIMLAGPGLPIVDAGQQIPRVQPRECVAFDVFIEDDLKTKD